MSNSLTSGFRRSIWGILGQQAALVIHVMIVALGVGVLVASSPVAFNAIRYAGAAYLVYLGVRQFLTKPQLDQEQAESLRNEPAWSMFRRGLWVNLLNPKAIVFFLAFMPQFIRPEQPLLPQYLVLTATVVVIDILVMWFSSPLLPSHSSALPTTPAGSRSSTGSSVSCSWQSAFSSP